MTRCLLRFARGLQRLSIEESGGGDDKARTMDDYNTAMAKLLLVDSLSFQQGLVEECTQGCCLVKSDHTVVCLDLLQRAEHRSLMSGYRNVQIACENTDDQTDQQPLRPSLHRLQHGGAKGKSWRSRARHQDRGLKEDHGQW